MRGRENAGVVGDHHITVGKILDDIFEQAVLDFPCIAVNHHQAGFVTVFTRVFGDQLIRKIETEFRKFHFIHHRVF